jgi:hypothetical protein
MYIVLANIEEEATAAVPSVGSEDKSDFVIEAGILKKYTGAGGDVVIPVGVTRVERVAFEKCSGLTGITIPNSVTSIGWGAFWKCSGLTGITIPDSVTSIERTAFDACCSLKNVSIPDGVTNIEGYAFSLCSGLTSVTMGNGVRCIDGSAFYGCGGLKEIHSKSPTPPKVWGSLAFGGSSKSPGVNKETCKLYVPVGAKAAYGAAEEWKEFKNIIEEETGVSPVADSSVRAYVSDGGITIKPGRPAEVSVYTVSGQKVYQSEIAGNLKVRLNKGAYIVTAGTTSQKVVVE